MPVFLQNKYGEECRHGRTMSFCSVLCFPGCEGHEEQSIVTFLVPPFFPKVFSMFLSVILYAK